MNKEFMNAVLGEEIYQGGDTERDELMEELRELKKKLKKAKKKAKKSGKKKGGKKVKKLEKRIKRVERQLEHGMLEMMSYNRGRSSQSLFSDILINNAPKIIELGIEAVRGINQRNVITVK